MYRIYRAHHHPVFVFGPRPHPNILPMGSMVAMPAPSKSAKDMIGCWPPPSKC
jgi:hypothetical protein